MAERSTDDRLPKAFQEPLECKDPHSSLVQVSFDVNQMLNTFFALRECAPSPSNTGYTAYLESCLLHVRNLLEFFDGTLNMWKITVLDFVPGDRSLDVIQAQHFILVRDVIDQYLVAGNGLRTRDCSLQIHAIIGAAVVALADAFKSFVEQLPAGSVETKCLENSTRVALEKLKTVEDFKE